jgi:methyl-accepting chemotaxis protein
VKAIKDYLTSIEEDISILATSQEIRDNLRQFQGAWEEITDNKTQFLQKGYINDNPHPIGEKEKLDYHEDGSSYSYVHQTLHPWFRQTLYSKGYYDMFLVNLQGDIIYTVYKEPDFATNLKTGQWKDTTIARLFEKVMSNPTSKAFYEDFAAYQPSNGVPAAFIGQGIKDERDQVIGAVILQMPLGRIQGIVGNTNGLGLSGDSYVVGEHKMMLTNSRFAGKNESTILKKVVDSPSVVKGLAKDNGIHSINNEQGAKILSSYAPIEFLGATWVLLCEIPEYEVFAPLRSMFWNLMWSALVANILIALVAGGIAVKFANILSNLANSMYKLANNDLGVTIDVTSRTDEIGDMGKALIQFKDNALALQSITEEQARHEERAQHERMALEKQRKQDILDLSTDFENQVQGIASMIAATSTELCATAENMKRTVNTISSVTNVVSSSSSQTATNVQNVADSINQMSQNVQQIMNQIDKSIKVVAGAVSSATTADTTVTSLGNAVAQIGTISEVIEGITGRINLLALNATIESARAGEVGRGFGVVASQVKNLAGQTAQATTQIIENISNVRNVSQEVVSTLKEIQDSITEVQRYSSQIADSMNKQSKTTNLITDSMNSASVSVAKINSSINDVVKGVDDATISADEVLSVAGVLSEQSERLNQQMLQFLNTIRTNNAV